MIFDCGCFNISHTVAKLCEIKVTASHCRPSFSTERDAAQKCKSEKKMKVNVLYAE